MEEVVKLLKEHNKNMRDLIDVLDTMAMAQESTIQTLEEIRDDLKPITSSQMDPAVIVKGTQE